MVKEKTYLEKVKTDFVTDPKAKRPITERSQKLRDTMLAVTPKLCAERARLYTESWKATAGEPLVIRRAKAFAKIVNEMTIFIRPGELIVGNLASDVRAAPVFPEFYMEFYKDELDGKPYRFEDRPGERFLVTAEDEKILRELVEWWRGKTMTDYKKKLYPDDVYKANYDVGVVEILVFGEGGGSGHFIEDFPKALALGFNGIKKEVEERLAPLKLWEPEDLEKWYFYRAVIITLDAAINFGRRFAALARQQADKETDPTRKAELLKISENCEWVPANAPRSFWEAIQLVWFLHLLVQIESNGHSVSYGRLDQYLHPFYERDIQAGVITPEEVVELLECLVIKTTELNKVRSWDSTRVNMGYQMYQQLTVGGQTRDHESAVNDLSYLVVEAVENQKLTAPSLAVRYWDNIPEGFLLKSMECVNAHRGGQPQMHNDEVIIPSQIAMGATIDDAYDWAVEGCVSPAIPGKSRREGISAGYNLHKILELTLYNGRDPRTGIQLARNPGNKDLSTFGSFDEFKAALKHQTEYYNRLAVIGLNCTEKAYAELTPTPFTSAFIDDCLRLGKDIELGGARYKTIFPRGVGMANVGNSLAAIKKLVFDEKKLTGAQIMHALETDFEDMDSIPTGEDIRQMLLSAPKFGNDDDYVDSLARESSDYMIRDMPHYRSWTGGVAGAGMLPVSQNIPFGEVIGATPDGRRAGVAVADGCSPQQGTDRKGPTAAVKSAAKLNHIMCDNGTLLNQKITPMVMKDMSGLRKMAELVRTYFEYKGQHIQFNVASAATLRDAQKNPQKYPDLLVRVAGYSALFVALDRKVQDDIISRTEQTF